MEDKHSEILWRVTIVLLVIAICGYGGIYAYSRLNPVRQTVTATSYTHRESIEAAGILVRSENLLSAQSPYSLVTALSGQKVAAGDVLGVSYESPQDMDRHKRMISLQGEIAQAVQALSGAEKDSSSAERQEATASAVLAYSECLAKHEASKLRFRALRLSSLIFDDGVSMTREEVAQLKNELAGLENQDEGTSRELISPASGIFTPLLDGCESISPAGLENLSVKSLRTLMAGHPSVDKRCYGKLVTDSKWYYAALVNSEDSTGLNRGDSVNLDLSAWRAGFCAMSVEAVSPESEGMRAVLLSSDNSLTETLELRTVSCPLILRSIVGIRLPKEAVISENYGVAYVRVDTGASERRQNVTLLYEGDGWVLVEGIEEGATVILP